MSSSPISSSPMRRLAPWSALAAILVVPLALAVTLPSYGSAAAAGGGGSGGPPGKVAFVEEGCNTCHSIASQGIERKSTSDKLKGPDLSDVGDRHDAAWIVKYVKRQVELDGAKHGKPYRGSDEDLAAMAAWLAKLKSAS